MGVMGYSFEILGNSENFEQPSGISSLPSRLGIENYAFQAG